MLADTLNPIESEDGSRGSAAPQTAVPTLALRRAEASQRTKFAHSTIDDAIHEANITAKKTTIYNARRCPVLSARCCVALSRYDVGQTIFLDASHIGSDVAQRKRARKRAAYMWPYLVKFTSVWTYTLKSTAVLNIPGAANADIQRFQYAYEY